MKTRGLSMALTNFQKYDRAVEDAYAAAFHDGAEHITDWERAHHRWQNQTGRAEAGLLCKAGRTGTGLRLVNAQTDPQRWMLETMQEGRFAILREAVRRHFLPILQEGARRARAETAHLRGSVSG